jgi:glycine cleavage system regulatory protein
MATRESTDVVTGLLQIAGPNQTGMFAQTSTYVHKHGGNIITCHAVRFGRQLFSGTMLISAPPDAFAKLEAELSALKAWEPRLLRTRAISNEERVSALMFEATIYAYDKEGVAAEITGIMAAEALDVVQLSAVTYPAPFDGQSLFMIEMILEAPDHLSAKRAYANLEALAPSRGWDIYWKPLLKTGLSINPLAAYPPSRMGLEVELPK